MMKPIVDQRGIGETKRDLIAGKEEVFIISGYSYSMKPFTYDRASISPKRCAYHLLMFSAHFASEDSQGCLLTS